MGRIIDSEHSNITGEAIRKIRKSRRMSQQELADKLETLAVYVCRGSISRIEDGSRTVSDFELYGIASVLGVSVDELFRH